MDQTFIDWTKIWRKTAPSYAIKKIALIWPAGETKSGREVDMVTQGRWWDFGQNCESRCARRTAGSSTCYTDKTDGGWSKKDEYHCPLVNNFSSTLAAPLALSSALYTKIFTSILWLCHEIPLSYPSGEMRDNLIVPACRWLLWETMVTVSIKSKFLGNPSVSRAECLSARLLVLQCACACVELCACAHVWSGTPWFAL